MHTERTDYIEMSGEYKNIFPDTFISEAKNKSHTEILDYNCQCSSTARTTTVTSQNRVLQWYSYQSITPRGITAFLTL